MEMPVVTTQLDAVGLRTGESSDIPVCIAEDTLDFVNKIKTLFERKDKRIRLAEQRCRFVELHYNWTKSAPAIEQMYVSATAEYSD